MQIWTQVLRKIVVEVEPATELSLVLVAGARTWEGERAGGGPGWELTGLSLHRCPVSALDNFAAAHLLRMQIEFGKINTGASI